MLDISHLRPNETLKIIIGAGEQSYDGWIATQQEQLDLLNREDWVQSFGKRQVDVFLCEHVWEHLTLEQGQTAAWLCYEFLKPGGYLRCAVPDANFPDESYQTMARGDVSFDHPAYDHKIVYDYQLFTQIFTEAGFAVDLLEYCDEQGRLHYNQWNPADGFIYRSLRHDHRNQDGRLGFVSLIIDAIKPA